MSKEGGGRETELYLYMNASYILYSNCSQPQFVSILSFHSNPQEIYSTSYRYTFICFSLLLTGITLHTIINTFSYLDSNKCL